MGNERIDAAGMPTVHFLATAAAGDLCWAWNALTNPAQLRTEERHAECLAGARQTMAALERRFRYGIDYVESDCSGRMLPVEGAVR